MVHNKFNSHKVEELNYLIKELEQLLDDAIDAYYGSEDNQYLRDRVAEAYELLNSAELALQQLTREL